VRSERDRTRTRRIAVSPLAVSLSYLQFPLDHGVFGVFLDPFGDSSGAGPAARILMKRLSVSNQNGAPIDAANAVISHPRIAPHQCLAT
jgi:hypothetical protein